MELTLDSLDNYVILMINNTNLEGNKPVSIFVNVPDDIDSGTK